MSKCELVETICRTTALQLRKVELSKYRPHAVCDTSTAHRRKADDLRISAMYGTRTEDAGLSCRSQHWSRHLHSCAMHFIRLMQNAVTVSEFPMPAIMHESVSSHCREFEDGYQKAMGCGCLFLAVSREPERSVIVQASPERGEKSNEHALSCRSCHCGDSCWPRPS